MSDYWHEIDEKEESTLASAIVGTVDGLKDELLQLHQNWQCYISTYLDASVLLENRVIFTGDGQAVPFEVPGSWNIGRAITSALVSKIAVQPTTVAYQTRGAPDRVQQKAKDREQLVQTTLRNARAPAETRQALRFGTVMGTAPVKAWAEGSNLIASYIRADHVIVDNHRTRCGHRPRVVFHDETRDLSDLRHMFRHDKRALSKIDKIDGLAVSASSSVLRKEVRVVEAYLGATDTEVGRRVIIAGQPTPDVVLLDEPFKRGTPFAWFHYEPPEYGFYGYGMIQHLEPIQKEINEILFDIHRNRRHNSRGFLGLANAQAQMGGLVSQDSPQDFPGSLRNWEREHDITVVDNVESGFHWQFPPLFSPQVVQLLELQWQKGFEVVGMSLLYGTSQRPAGLTTGEAVRQVKDIQSERYSEVQHNKEQLDVDVGELFVEVGAEASEWKVRTAVHEIRWKDVQPEPNEYAQLTVHPVSRLPHDPAGRLAYLETAVRSGFMGPEQAQQLFGWRDISKWQEMAASGRDELETTFERIIETGDYEPPLAMQNLTKGLALCALYWQTLRKHDHRDRKLALLETWRTEALAMLESAQQAAAPTPASGAGVTPTEGAPGEMQAATEGAF